MTAQEIYDATLANDGVTVDLVGNRPTTGYVVSELGGVEVALDKFSVADIEHVVAENKNALYGAGGYIGTWIDGETVYVDYSVNLQGLGEALTFGREHGQRAIYSLSTEKVIYL